MKIDKKIRDMPWPDPYHGGQQHFVVTLNWPVINHERLLVATFIRNRDKLCYYSRIGEDFRLVCSKKNKTAAILFKGDRCAKRKKLLDPLYGFGTSADTCYPEITPEDETALGKWLGMEPSESHNHLMPQLENWVADAVDSENLRERDARGELRDEDVSLCPEELPEGLVEHIRRQILPQDDTLIYKKGNTRGTCYICGETVKAVHPQRFRQHQICSCPNCGKRVIAMLEGSDHFRVDYVEDIATIQKGKDGKTVFIRQWHLLRDPSAKWENVAGQLEEVARYAVRGNRAAKWQHEAKENWYMNTTRYRLSDWTRVNNVTTVYDGQYFFYMPLDWKTILAGTSLQYCDLEAYDRSAKKTGRDKKTIRFLLDWARYPAVEKLWKAGYTGLVHERMRGLWKRHQHAIIWTRPTIRQAIRFPQRLLKLMEPSKWTMDYVQHTSDAWALVEEGRLRENEIAKMLNCGIALEDIRAAIGHASLDRILSYVNKPPADITVDTATYRKNRIRTYRDYLGECLLLGHDLDNRSILFPTDLDAAHIRMTTQIKYKRDGISEQQFEATRKKQLWLEWEHNGLLIRLPKDGDEIIAEGQKLSHCVGGYIARAARGVTTILFIRKVDNPDKPFYTLEWTQGHVQQCKAKCNKDYTQDEAVRKFVKEWTEHVRYLKKKKQNTKRKEKAA